VSNLTIAYNHFGTGHGLSIGSETNAGVSGISVYDLTIDGSIPTGGSRAPDVNGLRIKSDASHGGAVDDVSYSDICVCDLNNPILMNPDYSTVSGSSIPQFTNITVKDSHALTSGVSQTTEHSGAPAGWSGQLTA
jgi:polygalacturonase